MILAFRHGPAEPRPSLAVAALALALSLCPTGTLRAQAPEIATYEVGGRQRVVRRTEVAEDIALRYRRSPEGAEATKNLIDTAIIRTEAQERGLWPGRTVVEARVRQLHEQLQQSGRSLQEELDSRRISAAEFHDVCAVTVAHERLFRDDNDLDDSSEVTPTLLQLWLREARARHEILDDPDQVPDGTVAVLDGQPITLIQHGEQMLHLLPDDDLLRMTRRIVLRELVAREASRLGIEVTEGDIEAELAERKQEIESDPSYRGVPYEQWLLQIRGRTVDEYRRSAELLATVRHRKIGEQMFPDELLRKSLAEDRDAILARHGERRRAAILVVEGNARGKPRSVAEAEERARLIHDRVSRREIAFERAVEQASDDRATRARDGDLGPVTRAQEGLPTELLDVIFTLEPLELSEPVAFERGFAILRLLKVLPAPSDDELIEILRRERAQQWLEKLFEDASFEMTG